MEYFISNITHLCHPTFKAAKVVANFDSVTKKIDISAAKTEFGSTAFQYLYFEFKVTIGETSFENNWRLEYYDTGAFIDDTGIYHGDWWVKYDTTPAPKVTVSKLENGKISGNTTVTMFNKKEANDGIANPATRTLSIEFVDVPVIYPL
jgi:hypothetical protein